jgi:hypothetical protein
MIVWPRIPADTLNGWFPEFHMLGANVQRPRGSVRQGFALGGVSPRPITTTTRWVVWIPKPTSLSLWDGQRSTGRVLASYDYTVRADGKRTDLDETHWLDANTDGIRQASEVKATAYDWQYDAAVRPTDEAITHFDSSISQSEKFTYDLTGNRTKLERDHDGVAGIDEAITYNYDVNDRLITELFDDKTTANADTTTTYGYNHTQQTSKTISANSATSAVQLFSYNLQGRMSTVINDGYTNGTLSSRERTTYQYNSGSYRVHLITETGTTLSPNAATETGSLKSETSLLADSHNHTGYTQTIRETKVENGHTLITDYTFGNDEILQRVHGTKADGTSTDETLIFGHDGHGSVRFLTDLSRPQSGRSFGQANDHTTQEGIGRPSAGKTASTLAHRCQLPESRWDVLLLHFRSRWL